MNKKTFILSLVLLWVILLLLMKSNFESYPPIKEYMHHRGNNENDLLIYSILCFIELLIFSIALWFIGSLRLIFKLSITIFFSTLAGLSFINCIFEAGIPILHFWWTLILAVMIIFYQVMNKREKVKL